MNEVELGAKAFFALTAIGVLCGFASAEAFRRFADTRSLRIALNRVLAHLFELQLFSDEPALVIRAQRQLLAANGRFLLEMIRPSLVLALPFALVLIAIDALFGHAPLQVGKPALVTLTCKPAEARLPRVELEAPRGIRVETVALKIPRLREVSWRVRPSQAITGVLRIRCNGRVITKRASSGTSFEWLSDERAGSLTGFLLRPLEPPFLDKTAERISIEYPKATILSHSWMLWFCTAFCAGTVVFAVLLRWT